MYTMDWKKKIEELKKGTIPEHLAIIMDGNGRWAKRKRMPRKAGHKAGVEKLKDVSRWCGELGISVLTVYAFSTENWGRPTDEVSFLMKLFETTLRKEKKELLKNKTRVCVIGDRTQLPAKLQELIQDIEESSKHCDVLRLNIALNYGGRREILDAVENLYHAVKDLPAEGITQDYFSRFLYTYDVPDVDFLIRTGGDMRLSNFLLWQTAYAELYFTSTYWPDFNQDELAKALSEFSRRQRRFGKIREV